LENILYLAAAVLLIFWLVGVVGYSAGGLVHVLLVLAVISLLVEVISGRRKRI
jgi:hypothetical protein